MMEWKDPPCFNGDCDHDEDACPLEDVVVCAACRSLAYEINDEYLPDEALAENCPVCAAVDALRATTPKDGSLD
jgi:hypothetical protein